MPATKVEISLPRSATGDPDQLRLQGLDPDELVTYQLAFRIKCVEYPLDGGCILRVERYLIDPITQATYPIAAVESDDLAIGLETTDKIPLKDVIDPDTLEVISPAGSIQKNIKRYRLLLKDDLLGGGWDAPTTYKDVIRMHEKMWNRYLRNRRPNWGAGVDIVIDQDDSE